MHTAARASPAGARVTPIVRRNLQGTEMFTCANCGISKGDPERANADLVANIGFLIATRSPWWPSAVCHSCARQVRIFGAVCLVVVGALVLALVVAKLLP